MKIRDGNEPEPETPDVRRIFARDLTEKTGGNAMGVGQADFVHRDLVANLAPEKSLINAITASTVRGVRLPPVVETDRAGLIAALATVGVMSVDEAHVLRVTDTMHLQRCYASASLVEAARHHGDLRVVAEPSPVAFDPSGQFSDPSPEQGENRV